MTEELWDRTIDTCLKGAWLCMKYEIPQMVKQGGGAIVNTTSAAAVKPTPEVSAYCAAKAGIVQLTRVAALEYGKANIRINCVAPGLTRTPGAARAIETRYGPATRKIIEDNISTQPIGRWGKSEEIAEAVAWLCSDAASFVTGSHMIVDGGLLCL
jgi:NAD(P)-dependent dehydrogenase (short-subunit alcohol dehydrogenase family)